jgi:hypothetical protein
MYATPLCQCRNCIEIAFDEAVDAFESIARQRVEFETLNEDGAPSPLRELIDDSAIIQQLAFEAAQPGADQCELGSKLVAESLRLLAKHVEKNWRATAEGMVRS